MQSLRHRNGEIRDFFCRLEGRADCISLKSKTSRVTASSHKIPWNEDILQCRSSLKSQFKAFQLQFQWKLTKGHVQRSVVSRSNKLHDLLFTLKVPSDWQVSSNMLVAVLKPSGTGCPAWGDQAYPVEQRYLMLLWGHTLKWGLH